MPLTQTVATNWRAGSGEEALTRRVAVTGRARSATVNLPRRNAQPDAGRPEGAGAQIGSVMTETNLHQSSHPCRCRRRDLPAVQTSMRSNHREPTRNCFLAAYTLGARRATN